MILKLVFFFCFTAIHFAVTKSRSFAKRDVNVHEHIVRVNEAHDESRKGYRDTIPIEEEIVAVNEGPFERRKCKLFEGDLCLNPEDEAVVNHLRHETDLKRNVIRDRKKLWPNKIVYYAMDPNLKNLRPTIDAVIKTFHDKTCLKFREVDASFKGDHIKFFKGNGCWSKVGRSGGGQTLSLGSGCGYVGVIMHELMHAIGIWHEQSRPDRDSYVEILWHNIQPGKENNFKKYEHGKLDTLKLAYDLDSVMHYSRYLFSVEGKPTIIARGSPWKELGGQLRGTLTKNDVKEINSLYDC